MLIDNKSIPICILLPQPSNIYIYIYIYNYILCVCYRNLLPDRRLLKRSSGLSRRQSGQPRSSTPATCPVRLTGKTTHHSHAMAGNQREPSVPSPGSLQHFVASRRSWIATTATGCRHLSREHSVVPYRDGSCPTAQGAPPRMLLPGR